MYNCTVLYSLYCTVYKCKLYISSSSPDMINTHHTLTKYRYIIHISQNKFRLSLQLTLGRETNSPAEIRLHSTFSSLKLTNIFSSLNFITLPVLWYFPIAFPTSFLSYTPLFPCLLSCEVFFISHSYQFGSKAS